MKNKKQLKILSLIIAIILCCFFSTIAYSAIYTTMSINGVAYARVVKDVRITDFKLNSSSTNSTSSYEEFSVNTISTQFNLVDSSSSIVFDVEVTNYGSSDVGILNLIGTLPEGLSYEIINYNLEDKICDDTGKCNQMAVKTFQIKFTGTSGEYEVNLEFDFRTYHKVTYTDITNNGYPTEVIDGGDLNVTFKEGLKRLKVLSNGGELAYYSSVSNGQTLSFNNISDDVEFKIKEQVARLVSGEIDAVGSEVCIKEECFYIISNDGSTVTMLAKYNLYVGGKYENGTLTAYGDDATGLQNSTMLGYVTGQTIRNGNTVFSESNYWYDDALKPQYGNGIPAYVYDSNSIIYNYIQNYITYLNSVGVSHLTGRLITKDELIGLGCSVDDSSCSEAPSWVYSTSYWSGTASSSTALYSVIGTDLTGYTYNLASRNGVRPVIEMSVDDIYVPPVATVVNGDLDTVGSEVCIKDECFYVISSTDTTVTMLAKYNVTLEDVPKQSVDAETTVFSSDSKKGTYYSDYSGSIVEGYVNNYTNYLSSIGVTANNARLITYDEVSSLGCVFETVQGICESKYDWVDLVGYWTGSAYSSVTIISISEDGVVDETPYSSIVRGVRPVITISKSYF